mgnify:CR=1 FL=1
MPIVLTGICPATTTAPGTRQTCFMPLAHCKQLATLYRYGQGDLAPNGGGLCQLCQVRQSQLQRPAPLETGTAKVMRFGDPSRMAPFPDGRLIKETLHNKRTGINEI